MIFRCQYLLEDHNTQTTLKSPYIQHQQSNRALSQPPHPKMHQQLINNQAFNNPHGQHQRSGQPSSHTQQQQPSDGPSSQPSHNDHQQQQQQQKRAFKLPCTQQQQIIKPAQSKQLSSLVNAISGTIGGSLDDALLKAILKRTSFRCSAVCIQFF